MTTTEFSTGFDILYNNLMSNSAPPVNGYEKSVLLTKAQLELTKNYFNSKGNKYQEGFDSSDKRQIDFSGLIKVSTCTANSDTITHISSGSTIFNFPTDLMLPLNEVITLSTSKTLQVNPISYLAYEAIMKRPFKEPSKREAWRLINSQSANGIIVEIIVHTGDTVSSYTVRYVKRPTPIIVEDISSYSRTIDGLSAITECTLDASIHQEILQRAVELAKIAYEGDYKDTISSGERSE